jgi:two-component system, LytTR family, response regulator
MISSVLIDDEKISRDRLKRLLRPYTNIDIISEADNGRTAISLINDLKPDLIFLDIQMPEFTGFEVLQKIKHFPSIIFVTAYDDYALKAFEVNSIDYLLKPIEEKRLRGSIEKAKRYIDNKGQSSYHDLLHFVSKQDLDQFTVRFGDKVLFIENSEVSYIEAKEKNVFIHLVSGKEYIIDYTLNYLEEKLVNSFIRIHRSFLLNKKQIKEADRLGNGKYNFIMKDNTMTKISSSIGYSENVKKLFQI